MKRVSLQDVAQAAGVSRMTVSYALRDSPEVSEKVRAKIKALAERMGYRPDPLLQRFAVHLRDSRRSSYSGTLAYLIGTPDALKVPIYHAYLRAARWRAESLGYQLEEFWLGQKGMTGMKLSRILEHRGIEGIVIAPRPAPLGHLRLDWPKFAVAALGQSLVRPLVHRAANHQLHTGREAFRQLQRLGYQRIGLCVEAAQNRRVDYSWEYAVLAYQQRIPEKCRVSPLWLDRHAFPPVLRWIRKEKPEVILTLGGSWFHRHLVEAGYRIPEDIGIAVLDWSEAAPEFAGIDQRDREVGAAAVDLVVAQIYRNERGLPDAARLLLIEGRWRPGPSVRSLR